ncbi:MAG: PglZ domain-containing protein [Desulfobacterales bacterium]|nr:PglZ domain-containing protein [Desulfobacterales bacterium]
MIEIICDQYALCPVLGDEVIIQADSDYEHALQRIETADQQSIPLRLIVKNPAIFKWFDAPAKKHGCVIKRIDPIIELKKAIQRPVIPEMIRNQPDLIIELILLEKSKRHPIEHQETADDWLKRVLLGRVWQKNKLDTAEDIAEMFGWFLSNQTTSLHPFLQNIIQKQLGHWHMNSSPDRADFFKWLQIAPFKRSCFIVWEQSLKTYPPNRVAEWLQNDEIWFTLSQLISRDQIIPKLQCSCKLPSSIENFVRAFIEDQWQKSPANALNYISGQLEVERLFLTDELRKRLNEGCAISNDLFDRIATFSNFAEVQKFAAQLLPLPEPSYPDIAASVSDVQIWLSLEYLPFYNSCAMLNQVELTEPYLAVFEKWLKKHYVKMLVNGNGIAYRQIATLKNKVNTQPILIILFDGLDFLNAKEELLPVLQAKGIYPISEVMPYFSFLPSETFIAKPTLISGKMKSQIADEIPTASFYRDLIQSTLQLTAEKVRAATDKEMSLKELVHKPAAVYLYLDNQLDREYLHEMFKPYLRQKKYSEYLKKQAAEIVEAANLIEDLHNIYTLIMVGSDHGYTLLPKTAEMIQLNITERVKARSLYMSEVDKKSLDMESVWVLQSDMFGLNEEMAVPLGYRYFNKRPKGAIHGGASPQELAVPWILFSHKKPELMIPISFIIEGEIHRRRPENNVNIVITVHSLKFLKDI